MAEAVLAKTQHYHTLLIEDGTSVTALAYTIDSWDGVFSFTDPGPEPIVIYDGRTIDGVVKGREQPITGSFTVNMRSFSESSTDEGLLDMVYDTESFASSVSVAASSFSNFKLKKLTFTVEGTDFGDTGDHIVVFNKCLLNGVNFAPGTPNTITVNFICYGGMTRTAQ